MEYILIFRDLYTGEKKCHLFKTQQEAEAWSKRIDAHRLIGIRKLEEPVFV